MVKRRRKKLFLVSCVSKKRAGPLPAKDLYCSDWFLKARAYVEAQNAEWFILSAKFGVLAPNRVIRRYNVSLYDFGVDERRSWAQGVAARLKKLRPTVKQITVLAGRRYYEHLVPLLKHSKFAVRLPLKRLPIGRQLSWFKRRLIA